MKILGIDPGLTGAVAVYTTAFGTIEVQDIPTVVAQKGSGRKRRHINDVLLYEWLKARGPYGLAVIEQVSAMPRQGVSSTFAFGHAAGLVQGMVVAMEIPCWRPTPREWKKDMKLGRDKDQSRQLATQLFPRAAQLFGRKKDVDRAEAALLAVWGDRFI